MLAAPLFISAIHKRKAKVDAHTAITRKILSKFDTVDHFARVSTVIGPEVLAGVTQAKLGKCDICRHQWIAITFRLVNFAS